MREYEQLSSLVGDIYDAALDQALWFAVLGKTRGFVGGSAAILYSKDPIRRSGRLYYKVGEFDRHYRQLYIEKYAKLDPTTIGQFFADIEEPVSVADLMPYGEFLETRFYKEWVQPQSIVDGVTAALEKSAISVALFTVFRHMRDGRVDDEARHRMRLIVPHLRRAVLIGRVIDLKTAEAASFADTLDGVRAGMFLVDARGRIIHANAGGHALLAEGRLLHSAGGKLAADDAAAEQALHEAFLAANGGDVAVGTKGIAVPLIKRDGERYVAHVLPLTSGTRRRTGKS